MGKVALSLFCLSLIAGCAAPAQKKLKPGQTPDASSDEAGLWIKARDAEKNIRTSGKVVDDTKLQNYVRDTACNVSPDYCGDVRIYVVESPLFNAFMAPNGMMVVYTGMLLQLQNEAQLATILAHEMVHYKQRHGFNQTEKAQATMTAAMLSTVALGMAGVRNADNIVRLIAKGYVREYSREQESEADVNGFEMLKKAQYDVSQAPKVWKISNEVDKALDRDEPALFFATHPPAEKRMKALSKKVKNASEGEKEQPKHRKRYWRHIKPHMDAWLEDTLNLERWEQAQFLIDHLQAQKLTPGLLAYYQGELYRRRDDEGDKDKAITKFKKACYEPTAPAKCYRSQGLVLWSKDKYTKARKAFKRYIAHAPSANDAEMVKGYIKQLKAKET